MIADMLTNRSNHCVLRQANVTDATAISHLGSTTFALAYGAIVRAEDMARYVTDVFSPSYIAKEIVADGIIYMIAEIDSAIVGYAKLTKKAAPAIVPATCPLELERLYLAEQHRGQGVGDKLLSVISAKVMGMGHNGLWLRVWQKNDGAIRFYHRHGFKIIGSEPYFIGETANPVVLMYASLTQ
jgi:GNAT superfamily N-acetyltransferase